jgi:FtsH-binding integral membrane protein
MQSTYGSLEYGLSAAEAEPSARATFIRRTYAHLAGAILLFAVLEAYLLSLPFAEQFLGYASNRWVWLGILGGYMLISHIAESMAQRAQNVMVQYFALGLYVTAEAFLFVPLLTMAKVVSPDIIPLATLLTGTLTGGLTLVAFATKKDFSFLRSFLCVGGFTALGLIVGSAIFGFGMGLWFSGAMILLACAAILYSTSNVIHHYGTNQPIAAALSLFAAVALLFWYIVRILIQLYAASRD